MYDCEIIPGLIGGISSDKLDFDKEFDMGFFSSNSKDKPPTQEEKVKATRNEKNDASDKMVRKIGSAGYDAAAPERKNFEKADGNYQRENAKLEGQ